jgi:Ni/Co efflux regulator RcnB
MDMDFGRHRMRFLGLMLVLAALLAPFAAAAAQNRHAAHHRPAPHAARHAAHRPAHRPGHHHRRRPVCHNVWRLHHGHRHLVRHCH